MCVYCSGLVERNSKREGKRREGERESEIHSNPLMLKHFKTKDFTRNERQIFGVDFRCVSGPKYQIYLAIYVILGPIRLMSIRKI